MLFYESFHLQTVPIEWQCFPPKNWNCLVLDRGKDKNVCINCHLMGEKEFTAQGILIAEKFIFFWKSCRTK